MNRAACQVGQSVRRAAGAYGPQLVALAGIWVYFVASSATFRGTSAVYPVMEGFWLMGLVALGIGVTLIVGELDLSAGSMAAVAGVVAVKAAPAGLVACIAIATIAGACFGAVQGYVIARFKISSLVLTIGTLIMLRGLASVITNNKPTVLNPIGLADPLLNRWGVLSPSSVLALGAFAVVACFLVLTAVGRELYATGGARREAEAAGVSTSRAIVIAFGISGAAASLAGALSSVQGASADPANFQTLMLSGATAALIGGVSVTGGRGTVVNIILGVAIVSVIAAGLADRGAQAYTTQLVTGALLVVVIALEFAARRFRGGRRARVPA